MCSWVLLNLCKLFVLKPEETETFKTGKWRFLMDRAM